MAVRPDGRRAGGGHELLDLVEQQLELVEVNCLVGAGILLPGLPWRAFSARGPRGQTPRKGLWKGVRTAPSGFK